MLIIYNIDADPTVWVQQKVNLLLLYEKKAKTNQWGVLQKNKISKRDQNLVWQNKFRRMKYPLRPHIG